MNKVVTCGTKPPEAPGADDCRECGGTIRVRTLQAGSLTTG
jgi:hypothetical protein